MSKSTSVFFKQMNKPTAKDVDEWRDVKAELNRKARCRAKHIKSQEAKIAELKAENEKLRSEAAKVDMVLDAAVNAGKELKAENERLLVVCKDKHEAMNNYKLSCEDSKAENEKLKDLNHGYSGNIMDMDLERAEVLEVLEDLMPRKGSLCPMCIRYFPEHTDDCKLNALIKKMKQ